jgi:ABC-type antimicrobial peptide transport system permease subunit
VSPGFFAALNLPIKQGRDFNSEDQAGKERVVIVSESVARRLFDGRDVLNRQLIWTDPVMRFIGVTPEPRRIIGVVPDIDDTNVVPGPMMTVYHAFEQQIGGGRVFVHTSTDPYALVPQVTRIVRELAVDQPVERAATLEDIRAEVLTPDRLNAAVFGLFAVVALAIAVIGVAGVLAFSVSGRTREFGIRMALGSRPSSILAGVISSGTAIAVGGIVVGLLAGIALSRVAAAYVEQVQTPGVVSVLASAGVLILAGVAASAMPAARAARTNVIEALRAE